MSITKNLADFTGLVPPATEPDLSALVVQTEAIVFDTAVFTGGINHVGESDDWVFEFAVDPTGADLVLFDAVIAAHTGAALLGTVSRLRRGAEVTVSSASFASVLTSPFQPGPLVGGEWQLLVTVEIKLDAAATWGIAGPDRAVECQITRDGNELAQFQWPFATFSCFAFAAGDTHADGDDPVYDILIRRLGGAGNVLARRMKLEVAPVATGDLEEQA